MNDQRLSLVLSTFYERFRGSLFYVPAIYVGGATVLAWVTTRVDRDLTEQLPPLPFLLPTTVESARSILSTIAGATITVAGVVFSLTVIAAQLASSQFSPRVLRGLLRDRLSQHTIGVTVATFAYCLFVLAVTRSTTERAGDEPLQNVSVTLAVVLSVVAVLAIVAFLDHSARSMQAGEIIRRASAETHAAIERRFPPWGEGASGDIPLELPAREPDLVVRVESEGWIQLIHSLAILDALPDGAVAHIRARPGSYVIVGRPLVEVWGGIEDPGRLARQLQRAFATGDQRTLQQDVALGIRQMVDIALRAMSTGINDPTTAIESLFRLGGIVREIAIRDLPARVLRDDGRALSLEDDLDFAQIVRYAFRQIRVSSVAHPGVIKVLTRVLGEVAEEIRRADVPGRLEPIIEETRLTLAALEAHGHLEEDVAPIRETAATYGLV